MKHKRQLRWIRRSTASPEASDAEEGEGEKRQRAQQQPAVKLEAGVEEAATGPVLLPMQRAAQAAEAAAARQAAAAGSAVGPRPLGLAPVAVGKRGGGKGGRAGSEEPPGLRSPTGKPWLAVSGGAALQRRSRGGCMCRRRCRCAGVHFAACGSCAAQHSSGHGQGARVRQARPFIRQLAGCAQPSFNLCLLAPLQADHAFHEEHEGTDMRLGEAFQAPLPPYYGPLELLGEALVIYLLFISQRRCRPTMAPWSCWVRPRPVPQAGSIPSCWLAVVPAWLRALQGPNIDVRY